MSMCSQTLLNLLIYKLTFSIERKHVIDGLYNLKSNIIYLMGPDPRCSVGFLDFFLDFLLAAQADGSTFQTYGFSMGLLYAITKKLTLL